MTFWKQEPALIVGAVQSILALIAAFGFEWITPQQATAIVGFVSAAAVLVRSIVTSPATAETLADAAISPEPTPKQAEKAAQVLGVPASLIQEAVKFAAQGLLPPTWANLIVGADYSRLLEAVNEARRRAPTSQEMTDRYIEKAKGK